MPNIVDAVRRSISPSSRPDNLATLSARRHTLDPDQIAALLRSGEGDEIMPKEDLDQFEKKIRILLRKGHKVRVTAKWGERDEIETYQVVGSVSFRFPDDRTSDVLCAVWDDDPTTKYQFPHPKINYFELSIKEVQTKMDDENETYDGCLTYTWIHEQVLNMGYKCSLNKIRTILKNIDYGRWAKSPNCDLTEEHKSQRLRLANELLTWPKEDLNKIIWTDEKLFTCGVHGSQFFIGPKGCQRKLRCRNRRWYGGKGVMAWMGISVEHGFFLHVFEPNDNTTYENAHKVTGGVILDSFQKPNGFLYYLTDHVDNVTVQMDNATTHNLAKGELIKYRIKQLSWPANSPDLNPIENVWKQMNGIIKKKIKPHNHATLADAIKKAFQILKRPQEKRKVCNTIDSVPNRLQKVLQNNGGHSGH